MLLSDPLYGPVDLPEWLRPVLLSPEVQRLRWISLINTHTPSFPALSETRRFTHTIGAFHLCELLNSQVSEAWTKEQQRALQVAVLVHDVATPAFGHLFEYQLASLLGWSHEKFIAEVIYGTYRPEKRYHQILYSNSIKLHRVLRALGTDIDFIVALIQGRTPLSNVLAGSIDVDNMDNVFRMAKLLGLKDNGYDPRVLLDHVAIDGEGLVLEPEALPQVAAWQETRKSVYSVLAFDEWAISGQAMLTDCITAALKQKRLGQEHWHLTDEMLLGELASFDETKEATSRFAVADFYDCLFLGWYNCPKGDTDLRHYEIRADLTKRLETKLGIPCSVYVFYDNGTFSKDLRVRLTGPGRQVQSVSLSEKSESTIVGVFTPRRIDSLAKKRLEGKAIEFLEKYGLSSSSLMSLPDKRELYGIHSQAKLPFRA